MNPGSLSRIAVTGIVSAIAITPLCGVFFGCGCTWPVIGFTDHCNVYDQAATLVCPWCKDLILGTVITLLSITVGIIVASQRSVSNRLTHSVRNNLTQGSQLQPLLLWCGDCTLGICAFALAALVAAIVTALWTDHPIFQIAV